MPAESRCLGAVILLLLLPSAAAHSNILYDVSLDFDPALKELVTAVAQEHFGLVEEPVRFDYERELLIVQFDRKVELSANVDPSDFSLAGFRDDSRVSERGTPRLSQAERRAVAERVFETLPEPMRREMTYGGERELYTGTFQHLWYRAVDGVLVANEHLEVEVNGITGEVIAWKRLPFFAAQENIRTSPAISGAVARKVAELTFNAAPVQFTPFLLLNRDRPVWVVKVKALYPIYVWVDALDGRIVATGDLRATVPEQYAVGPDIPVQETDFIRNIREGKA